MKHNHESENRGTMNSKANIALIVFLLIGGYFLVTERGGAAKLVNGLSDISASMGGASCPQTGAERHEKTPP